MSRLVFKKRGTTKSCSTKAVLSGHLAVPRAMPRPGGRHKQNGRQKPPSVERFHAVAVTGYRASSALRRCTCRALRSAARAHYRLHHTTLPRTVSCRKHHTTPACEVFVSHRPNIYDDKMTL